MGSSTSNLSIDSDILIKYKKLKITNVGQALQKFYSVCTFNVASINAEDFSDIFYNMWRREGTNVFSHFGTKEIGVLEVFSVAYLLTDIDGAPFVQKLDALISLVQFKRMPESVDGSFAYAQPDFLTHKDQLLLMLECCTLGLCHLAGRGRNPVGRTHISHIVESIFGENIKLRWSEVKTALIGRRDLIDFLRLFIDVTYLPDLLPVVNSAVQLICREFRNTADPFQLKRRERHNAQSRSQPAKQPIQAAAVASSYESRLANVSLKVEPSLQLLTSTASLSCTRASSSADASSGKDQTVERGRVTRGASPPRAAAPPVTRRSGSRPPEYSEEERDYLLHTLQRVSQDGLWVDTQLFRRVARSLIAFNVLAQHSTGASRIGTSEFVNLHKLTLPPHVRAVVAPAMSPIDGSDALPTVPVAAGCIDCLEEAEEAQEEDHLVLQGLLQFVRDKQLYSKHSHSHDPLGVGLSRMQWVEYKVLQYHKSLRDAQQQGAGENEGAVVSASGGGGPVDIRAAFYEQMAALSGGDADSTAAVTSAVGSDAEKRKAPSAGISLEQVPTLVRQLLGEGQLALVERGLSESSRELALEHIAFTEQWLLEACAGLSASTGMVKWKDLAQCQGELAGQLAGLREYFQRLRRVDGSV